MKFAKITTALLFIALSTGISSAQSPFDDPQNLQVLPKDIPSSQLREIMRNFSFALGERCSYCHDQIEDENGELRTSFNTDNKDMKRVAREMIKLVGNINTNISSLNRGDEHQYTRVVCTTCHRGQANPFLIEQVLNKQIAEGGAEAAKPSYVDLKQKYYGGHTYDFTGFTLAEYSYSLLTDGDPENALQMSKFSTEQFPNEPYAHTILGNILSRLEKYNEAIKAYEKSLSINPDQAATRRQLERAKEAAMSPTAGPVS